MTEINNIPETPKIEPGPQHRYELQVRDLETGEVIYRNAGNAGATCFMEKVTEFGPSPAGQHQIFCFGNPILQFYCVDQLRQWFDKEGLPNTMEELERRGFIHANFNIKDLFKKGD